MSGRAAGVWLFARATGRTLLLLRSEEVDDSQVWGLPGGSIERNEREREAIVREVAEETGFTGSLRPLERVGEVRGEDGFSYAVYVGVVKKEFTPKLNWEHTEWGWFSVEDLPASLHPGLEVFVKHQRVLLAEIASDVLA